MRTGKYRTAQHRGGLKECLETEEELQEDVFKRLIDSKIYVFYAYDERIKANRYIIENMEHNLGLPTWLHEYIDYKK